MIRQGTGGKIVNISSMLGKKGEVLYTDYCASKFAVLGITKCLALELAKHKINVNAICPGDVQTEMSQYEADYYSKKRGVPVEEIWKEWASVAPLKKILQPRDIADIAIFLASDTAKNMTGQGINVTAGKIMF
jgi:meso-butanediol dehydrogenase/(S,S)-butanediol dehydrogenase/diacetyl reductase